MREASGEPIPSAPTQLAADDEAPPSASDQRLRRVGVALVAAGAVLGLLACTVLEWFRGEGEGIGGGSGSTFGDIHHQVDYLRSQFAELGGASFVHFGVSPVYFGWLAWVLLALAVVAGFAATTPLGRYSVPARVTAAFLAFIGLAVTLWALDLLSYGAAYAARARAVHDQVPTYAYFLEHTSTGAWAAVAAFVLIGVGGTLGPLPAPDRPSKD